MAAPVVIRVDIWSDLACPWCHVGEKRVASAIKAFQSSGRAKFQLCWHPYMIDTATKASGEEYLAYNKRRWGSDSWTHHLRAQGRDAGATFLDWQWWPNTLLAHLLVKAAEAQGLSTEAVTALFSAAYEEGQNISSPAILEQICLELGIDSTLLDSDDLKQQVLKEDRAAKQQGICSVPFYMLTTPKFPAFQQQLSGSQPVNALLALFAKASAEAKARQPDGSHD